MSEVADRIREDIAFLAEERKGRDFNNELGMELEDYDDECGPAPIASFIYRTKPEHLNNFEGLHGGIVASLFDSAIGHVAVALAGGSATTTDLSVSFMRFAQGDKFRIIVEMGHVGGHMISGHARLYSISDDPLKDDVLCASCLGNYYVLGGDFRDSE